jgi:hypothetical protein
MPVMPFENIAKPISQSQLNFFFCDERVHAN